MSKSAQGAGLFGGLVHWWAELDPVLVFGLGVLVVLAAALATLAAFLVRRMRAIEEDLHIATASIGEQRRLDNELKLVSSYLAEFSNLLQTSITNVELRRIPELLVSTVQRMFGAEQAIMLVRRKTSLEEPDREQRLIVAAMASPQRGVEVGDVVPFGVSHLGLVAASQRVLSREEAERESAVRISSFPSFDLAAPLLVQEQTVGVIAYHRPDRHHRRNAEILLMVARLGAMAWHTVSAYQLAKVSAEIDGLTSVLNKNAVRRRLGETLSEAQRRASTVSVFLFDIDHFKNYNDVNGHLAGDNVLRTLSRLVSESVRTGDLFGRFGGEEFLLVMRGLTPLQAMSAAKNVSQRIADYVFPNGERQPLGKLTVSGGVATYPDDGTTSVELIRQADQALYRAKNAGRNRVLRARSGVGATV